MRTHLSLVNQKLGFAKSMLSLIKEDSDTLSSRKKMEYQALSESVLLHLYTAFHFYLRELATNNGIKNPEAINSLEHLQASLAQMGKSPSEVAELKTLASLGESWLSDLLVCYSQIFKSPVKPVEKKAFGSESLIDVVDLTQKENDSEKSFNPDLLQIWISEMQALISRQRETGAEY